MTCKPIKIMTRDSIHWFQACNMQNRLQDNLKVQKRILNKSFRKNRTFWNRWIDHLKDWDNHWMRSKMVNRLSNRILLLVKIMLEVALEIHIRHITPTTIWTQSIEFCHKMTTTRCKEQSSSTVQRSLQAMLNCNRHKVQTITREELLWIIDKANHQCLAEVDN